MKRTSSPLTAVATILLALTVYAQHQQPRRAGAPVLTNDDVLSPRTGYSLPEENINRTGAAGGSALRNARTVLQSALTRMGEVSSLRTRLQTSLPTGQREVLIESVKPDRTHIISADGEMIMIGRKFYFKSGAGWQVTSLPAGSAQAATGLDYRTFMKEMMAKSGVRITGQIVGGQVLDGVDTVAYEFAVTDGSETGTIQVCVGKEDGYMRRMFLQGGGVEFRIWFTNINEQLSIEPPL
jgi:hypothetical protein